MGGIPEEIAERPIALFDKVHPDYGAGVRKARAEFAGREPAISVTPATPQQAAE